MSVKLHHRSFVTTLNSCSTSNKWIVQKSSKFLYPYRVVDLDHNICEWNSSRKLCLTKCTEFKNSMNSCSCRFVRVRRHRLFSHETERTRDIFLCASADDGVTVNGNPQARTSRDVEAMRVKLSQSLQNEDYNDGLVQSLHDAARVFELSIREHRSLSKLSWFSAAWLGMDKTAWVKGLSYQASVYSVLQAAVDISSCGDRRDREINIVVQRSLLRLSAPLESIIREKLSARQPELFEWFWSEQVPVVVTTFVDHFERDPRFNAGTMSGKRMPVGSENANDVSLLMLALMCTAAITKIGPAKVSCSQFFSLIPDVSGRLMDMLVGLIPIHEAHHAVKEIGLRREFLVHFGSRAASCGVRDDSGTDEIAFWLDLVQKQLQRAIDRERIWSRLTTSESIEVLERDLAIFGFFIALGRSTRAFLTLNGFDKIEDPIEGLIRYLIGGSVLNYPQLSSISSYELYVEVVCEELDWLPFYPGYSNTIRPSHGHKSKSDSRPNAEAIPQVIDVCSRWIRNFIKHSQWVGNPSNVKAAAFLSKGHDIVKECMEELRLSKDDLMGSKVDSPASESRADFLSEEPESFDKALESVEGALVKLENLLQQLHVSSSSSGKEHLKAACSDLEKIRRLKKEAEFLEASFRAKAACLQQESDDIRSSSNEQRMCMKSKYEGGGAAKQDKSKRVSSTPRGFWSLLLRPPMKQTERGPAKDSDKAGDDSLGQSATSRMDGGKSDSNEIHRFEILRNELMELEERVQKSANHFHDEEDIKESRDENRGAELVPVQTNRNLIGKSIDKLKETTTDVWQGTQLLAIDVASATGLLRRAVIGDELTEKEKRALRRTLTDLASVVPIGVLMLLPVTAVGHAAILAAIQRYVPALIPSTYGSERLDLLRQLERMKEMENSDAKLDENVEELA